MRRSSLLFAALALAIAACSPANESTTTTGDVTAPTTTLAVTSSTGQAEGTTTTSGGTTTDPLAVDVVVEGGTADVPGVIVTGPDKFSATVGDQVEIRVLSSVDDEIHVHGYDLHFDAVAGEVTVVSFVADVPGIFEAELEEHEVPLFELEVTP